MEERRPNLVEALRQMGDFYMELKWDFQSWGKQNGINFLTDIDRTLFDLPLS